MNNTAIKPIENMTKNEHINIADIFIRVSFFIEVALIFFMLFFTDSQFLGIFLFFNVYFLFFSIIFALIIMGINRHFPIFAFYCCYFIFLLGRKFVQCFSRDIATVYNSFSTKFVQATLNGIDYLLFTSLLYVSILTVFLLYKFFIIKKLGNTEINVNYENKLETNVKRLKVVQKTAQIMSWITLIFALAERIIILRATSDISYSESYQINVYVPSIIKIFNAMFESCVLIFLATRPKKSAMWSILIAYVFVDGFLMSANGNRAQLGTCILLAGFYLLIYYKVNLKKFKLKWLLYIIVFGVVVLFAFWYIEMSRSNKPVQDISLLAILENILDSLGGSDSVIAGIIIRADKFPQDGIVYLLDPIKRAVTDNPLMRIVIGAITGQTIVSYPQGMDNLLHYNSFADWFSYIGSPDLYLSGAGSGSSYIAECYFALGFLGVIIASAVLGIIIAKITAINLSNGKIYKNALGMFFLPYIFTLPRGSTFGFATQLLYFVFTIILFKIIENLVCCSKQKST